MSYYLNAHHRDMRRPEELVKRQLWGSFTQFLASVQPDQMSPPAVQVHSASNMVATWQPGHIEFHIAVTPDCDDTVAFSGAELDYNSVKMSGALTKDGVVTEHRLESAEDWIKFFEYMVRSKAPHYYSGPLEPYPGKYLYFVDGNEVPRSVWEDHFCPRDTKGRPLRNTVKGHAVGIIPPVDADTPITEPEAASATNTAKEDLSLKAVAADDMKWFKARPEENREGELTGKVKCEEVPLGSVVEQVKNPSPAAKKQGCAVDRNGMWFFYVEGKQCSLHERIAAGMPGAEKGANLPDSELQRIHDNVVGYAQQSVEMRRPVPRPLTTQDFEEWAKNTPGVRIMGATFRVPTADEVQAALDRTVDRMNETLLAATNPSAYAAGVRPRPTEKVAQDDGVWFEIPYGVPADVPMFLHTDSGTFLSPGWLVKKDGQWRFESNSDPLEGEVVYTIDHSEVGKHLPDSETLPSDTADSTADTLVDGMAYSLTDPRPANDVISEKVEEAACRLEAERAYQQLCWSEGFPPEEGWVGRVGIRVRKSRVGDRLTVRVLNGEHDMPDSLAAIFGGGPESPFRPGIAVIASSIEPPHDISTLGCDKEPDPFDIKPASQDDLKTLMGKCVTNVQVVSVSRDRICHDLSTNTGSGGEGSDRYVIITTLDGRRYRLNAAVEQ